MAKSLRSKIRALVRRFTGRQHLKDYQIQVVCPKERYGTIYGGWTICPASVTHNTIVYSFGVGEDISFDLALISHTILDRPSTSQRAITVTVYRLQTILERLGHNQIDILKLDIEGAEYSVLLDMVRSDIQVRQLLVECHHQFPKVDMAEKVKAIQLLNRNGYRIFYLAANRFQYSFIH